MIIFSIVNFNYKYYIEHPYKMARRERFTLFGYCDSFPGFVFVAVFQRFRVTDGTTSICPVNSLSETFYKSPFQTGCYSSWSTAATL